MADNSGLGAVAARLAAATRILVVEDEPDLVEFLGAWFRASGYDLVHTDPTSIEMALAALDQHQPDCVLLDVSLRGISGLDVYAAIRDNPRYASVPIIIVSADATVPSRLPKGFAELDDFVTKPFSVNTLGGLVKERIELGRLDAKAGMAGEQSTAERISQDTLQDKLDQWVDRAGSEDTVSFGLATVSNKAAIIAEVGQAGLEFVERRLTVRAREAFPGGTLVAQTSAGELAIVSSLGAEATPEAFRKFISSITLKPVGLPGGAEVAVRLACGVASYPDNAANGDELYMACDVALADARDQGNALVIAV